MDGAKGNDATGGTSSPFKSIGGALAWLNARPGVSFASIAVTPMTYAEGALVIPKSLRYCNIYSTAEKFKVQQTTVGSSLITFSSNMGLFKLAQAQLVGGSGTEKAGIDLHTIGMLYVGPVDISGFRVGVQGNSSSIRAERCTVSDCVIGVHTGGGTFGACFIDCNIGGSTSAIHCNASIVSLINSTVTGAVQKVNGGMVLGQ